MSCPNCGSNNLGPSHEAIVETSLLCRVPCTCGAAITAKMTNVINKDLVRVETRLAPDGFHDQHEQPIRHLSSATIAEDVMCSECADGEAECEVDERETTRIGAMEIRCSDCGETFGQVHPAPGSTGGVPI
jgi:hypothetical protein